MNLGTLLRISIVVAAVALLAGAMLKIYHTPAADWLLGLGLLAALAFVVAALVEIASSRQLSGGEKVLWMTVVLLGNALGAFLYLVVGRRRVTAAR